MGNQTYQQRSNQDNRIPVGKRRTEGGKALEDNRAAFNATPLLGAIKKSGFLVEQQTQLAAMSHSNPSITAQRQRLDNLTGGSTLQLKEEQVASAQRVETPAAPNNTGLPDQLKSGIESLSGLSMDNVKVHYNSAKPAQLNALAYAQGTDIHVAPGQEQHLPHEAWHVVQQAQGRVKPTMQMKDGIPVNDDAVLEREADLLGAKALQMKSPENASLVLENESSMAVPELGETWKTSMVQGKAIETSGVRGCFNCKASKNHARKSIGYPTTAPAETMSIQRVVDSKKELAPDIPSETVPDLPQNIVDVLNAAIANEDDAVRLDAIQQLVNHLATQDVVDRLDELHVQYVADNANLADVDYADEDSDELNLTVSAALFSTAGNIYSTVRHELIHVAQRRDVPIAVDRGPSEEDGLMYISMLDGDYDAANMQSIQIPLQEIETHVYEILNAVRTGASAAHIQDTRVHLSQYVATLRVNLAPILQAIVVYWKPYIEKAIQQVRSLNDAELNPLANQLNARLREKLPKKKKKKAAARPAKKPRSHKDDPDNGGGASSSMGAVPILVDGIQ